MLHESPLVSASSPASISAATHSDSFAAAALSNGPEGIDFHAAAGEHAPPSDFPYPAMVARAPRGRWILGRRTGRRHHFGKRISVAAGVFGRRTHAAGEKMHPLLARQAIAGRRLDAISWRANRHCASVKAYFAAQADRPRSGRRIHATGPGRNYGRRRHRRSKQLYPFLLGTVGTNSVRGLPQCAAGIPAVAVVVSSKPVFH